MDLSPFRKSCLMEERERRLWQVGKCSFSPWNLGLGGLSMELVLV